MRICHVSWEYPPVVYGGLGRHVHAVAREQARAGHQVTVLSHVGIDVDDATAGTTEETIEGVRVIRIPRDAPYVEFAADALLGWVAGLTSALVRAGLDLREDVDIWHAHDWLTAHAASMLRAASGIPWVHTIHATEAGRHQGWLPGDLSRSIHSIEGWSAHSADRVIVCSQHMRWEVQRLFEMPDAVVIPNGVEVSSLLVDVHQREAIRERYGNCLIVYTGRLEWEKGAHTLIEALPRLRRSFPTVQCVIAGRGSQAEPLMDLARRKRVASRVHVRGWLPEVELRALVDAADVAVVPSLYEPFGIVALEAAAVRTPVVAARAGGLSEFLADDQHGFGFSPGDPSSLADAVHAALTHRAESLDRVERAHEFVATQHGWPTIAERTVLEYRAVRTADSDRVRGDQRWALPAVLGERNLFHEQP
ncbi:MAG TPA: glycosyltransferase family 4 protein [Candidatus Nanopelagicales bacterium]|nr:glycosyltransferase family 4 protein [Candidatus Nanopelagicales bacterium]